MKYGPLGRSGLIVSKICLGGNSWGAKGRRGWGKFDENEAPAYFKRALGVGITFFDTADNYNFGRSEEIMGAELFEAFPHTEGLRLVASSTAIFDQDLHRFSPLAAL